VWAREVLRGVANQRPIDGKDRVADSIPPASAIPLEGVRFKKCRSARGVYARRDGIDAIAKEEVGQ
jgi:hypothetical protein